MGGCCGSGGNAGKNIAPDNKGKDSGNPKLLFWIAGGLLIIVLYYLLNGSV